MSIEGRPLSPHLSVYRWPITMMLSILHRATGVGLSLGFAVFALWLMSAASGAASYNKFSGLLQSGLGRLLLIGWSFAFFFHLANGVRHLFWDLGLGLEKLEARRSAWSVIILSVALTVSFWIFV